MNGLRYVLVSLLFPEVVQNYFIKFFQIGLISYPNLQGLFARLS
jgi:hypothetical protein